MNSKPVDSSALYEVMLAIERELDAQRVADQQRQLDALTAAITATDRASTKPWGCVGAAARPGASS